MKVDFKKEYKELYLPSAKEISMVTAPPMRFLMIDGQGDPNTAPEYQDAVQSLYSLAYTISLRARTSWTATIRCRRWRGSGGRRIWPRSA